MVSQSVSGNEIIDSHATDVTGHPKVEQDSRGFDVDARTGSLPYGFHPVPFAGSYWVWAEIAAGYSAAKTAEDGGINVEYKHLVKANFMGVNGLIFYLTFIGFDTNDQLDKIYRSKVWVKAGPRKTDKLNLLSFQPFTHGDKTVQEMRMEIASRYMALARKGFLSPFNDSSTVERVKSRRGELVAKGFLIFLNEIRSKKSSRKYNMAKRIASRKWKLFDDCEKLPYIKKAVQQFKEKTICEETSTHHT